MPIKVACLECNRVYELPNSAAGRKGKCECGAMLDVPAAEAKPPKPPRTLEDAAQAAQKKREPEFNPAALAALADEKRQERLASAPADETPPESSPPPPPADPTGGDDSDYTAPPPLPPKPAGVKKYRNLRAYCYYLRIIAILIAIATVLLVVGETLVLVSVWASVPADPMVMVRTGLGPLGSILLTLCGGFLAYVFLNALAELFHVLMDIEENTRR